jgi:hypothetical protein
MSKSMVTVEAHPCAFVVGWATLNAAKEGDKALMRQNRRIRDAIEEKTGPVDLVDNPYATNTTVIGQIQQLIGAAVRVGCGTDVTDHLVEATRVLGEEKKYERLRPDLQPDLRVSVQLHKDDWKFLSDHVDKQIEKKEYHGPQADILLDLIDAIDDTKN